jgi:glucosyl-dolichyl phosphate glucuronosyltransferase
MDVSVILATYRRPTLLARTLESFRELRVDGLAYELLVVDNGSPRETQAVLARSATGLPVRLLVETTRGKNHALNRAIPEARGALLVFTDDDVVVDREWLLELAGGAGRWPEHQVFGGRVLPLWPTEDMPSRRHKFLTHAYAIADRDQPEGPYWAGWVFDPNMAIRATVFQAGWRFNPAVGPNGTPTYMSGGESELLFRLERNGVGAVYLPRARVLHQIRPEQLRVAWLYGRAFRKGRWDFAKTGAAGPRLFGVPRAVLAELVAAYARFLAAHLKPDAAARFDRGLSYWRLRGMLYESRRRGSGVGQGIGVR